MGRGIDGRESVVVQIMIDVSQTVLFYSLLVGIY